MARPTLKKGMSGKKGTEVGEAILLWRLFLGKPELKPAAGTTSYDFGSLSDKFTKEFQKSVGLTETGIVDANTWNAYNVRIAKAPAPVQAAAKAAEAVGEAKKAEAMAAVVAAKPKAAAPKPVAAAPKPVPTIASVAAAAPAAVKAKVQDVVVQLKSAASAVSTKAQTVKAEMPMWQRILSVGILGLGGLVGFKALSKK